VLEELTVSGSTNLAKVFTYGLDLLSQRVIGASASTHYFGYDGHGSTRFLTDAGGNIANTFAFDAYGTLIASNAAPQTAYLYCGEQFDSNLGFYYLRARYLKPDTGRFWTMDSFEGNPANPRSLHKYLYASADSANRIDPSGNSDISLNSVLVSSGIGATIGAFAGAIADYAHHRTVTWRAVWQGAAVGAVLGPGALVPSTAVGLGIGGMLMGASEIPILMNPSATWDQKAAATIMIATSLYGPRIGAKVAKTTPRVSPRGGNCFLAGTMVLMANGSQKAIETVEAGDLVLARHDGQATVSAERVRARFNNYTLHVYRIGFTNHNGVRREFKVTGEHPLFVAGDGWVLAKDVRQNDRLLGHDGALPTVVDVALIPASAATYNLSVEEAHTFFVVCAEDSVLVHNAEYDIVPYGTGSAPNEEHHGILNEWLKQNLPTYYQGRQEPFPAIELSPENHENTKQVYREWLRQKTGSPVGGKVDWKAISWEEMQGLMEKMYDAAKVPENIRENYHTKAMEWLVIRACN
jgi:RHS repeat-associated protein